MADTRHSWINFPTKNKQKCTKCGCIKEKNKERSDGSMGSIYHMNNNTFDLVPKCNN